MSTDTITCPKCNAPCFRSEVEPVLVETGEYEELDDPALAEMRAEHPGLGAAFCRVSKYEMRCAACRGEGTESAN